MSSPWPPRATRRSPTWRMRSSTCPRPTKCCRPCWPPCRCSSSPTTWQRPTGRASISRVIWPKRSPWSDASRGPRSGRTAPLLGGAGPATAAQGAGLYRGRVAAVRGADGSGSLPGGPLRRQGGGGQAPGNGSALLAGDRGDWARSAGGEAPWADARCGQGAGYRRDRTFAQPFPRHGGGGGDICLLYTSDAADEADSVDLGGRRIIKKKKKKEVKNKVNKQIKKKDELHNNK